MKDKAVELEDLSPMERILLDEEEIKLEEEGGVFGDMFRDVEVTYEMEFENIDDPFDGLSSGGTMMFKGSTADLAKAVTKIEDKIDSPPEEAPVAPVVPTSEPSKFVAGLDEKAFVADTIMHPSMSAREQLEPIQRWQATEHLERIDGRLHGVEDSIDAYRSEASRSRSEIKDAIQGSTDRLSTSVDLAASEFGEAATKFEGAADAFETASSNFNSAAGYFQQASEEFAKLPDAIKNGLEQMGERLADKISEINPKILEGDLEEVSEEEIDEYIGVAEDGLSGTDVPFIAEYAELTFSRLPSLLTSSRYNYKKFENLKPLVGNDLNADFDVVTATVKTKKQTLNWIRNSFVTTLTYYASDEALDETMLNKKDREEYNWRQYIKGVMEVAKDDNDFLPMLGITPAD